MYFESFIFSILRLFYHVQVHGLIRTGVVEAAFNHGASFKCAVSWGEGVGAAQY